MTQAVQVGYLLWDANLYCLRIFGAVTSRIFGMDKFYNHVETSYYMNFTIIFIYN